MHHPARHPHADRTPIGYLRFIIGIGIAVLVSVFLTIYIVRDNQVEECIRSSQFKVTEARAWEQASKQREADGDYETADVYQATAKQIRSTIPVEKGFQGVPRGDLKLNRIAGCGEAFPPPINFID